MEKLGVLGMVVIGVTVLGVAPGFSRLSYIPERPSPVDKVIPQQHHTDGAGQRHVVSQPGGVDAQGQQATSQEGVEDRAEGNEDGGADDEADYIDQHVLNKLDTQPLGTRVPKSPVPVEDEIAGNRGKERNALCQYFFETQQIGSQIENRIIDQGADSPNDGKFDKPLLLFTGGEETH